MQSRAMADGRGAAAPVPGTAAAGPQQWVPPAAPGSRGPGLKDVAALAGVSHQTVSRVLNSPGQVRGDTRSRVLSAIRQLDYRPNSAARALVTGRSRRLGVVVSYGSLYGPASVLHGVEEAARDSEFFVSAVSLRTPTWPALREAVGHLVAQGVEGIVVTSPLPGADRLTQLAQLPVVAVGRGTGPDTPAIDTDQVLGAAAATNHLLDLGHETVWHVSGATGWPAADERVAGWQAALAMAGAAAPPLLTGDWSAASGFTAGQALAANEAVRAVFVGNDQMALGVLRALREHGRRVPEDVSVVGFDDIPEAAYYSPPLTTVRQDFDELGRRCVRLLLDVIDAGRPSGGQLLLDARLVLRASTVAPGTSPGAAGGPLEPG